MNWQLFDSLWVVAIFAGIAFLAALSFLRVLAINLAYNKQVHDAAYHAVRIRRAYDKQNEPDKGVVIADDGVIEV